MTAREALQGCKQRVPACELVPGDPSSVLFWDSIRGMLPVNPQEQASLLYGTYTALVYATPFFGGIIADRWLGQRKTVLLGGSLMALGHFAMASEDSFFLALGLLILGNGAFKPNISTQVGNLYPPGDPRRDGAFTIFYMGINLGAFICNLVCGTLAVVYGWHYGFAAAGVGMLLGLDRLHARAEAPGRRQPEARHAPSDGVEHARLDEGRKETRRGASRAVRPEHRVLGGLRAARQHDADLGRRDAQSGRPCSGFRCLRPGTSRSTRSSSSCSHRCSTCFWRRQAKRGTEPTSVSKMAIGCFVLGSSFLVMILGAQVLARRQGQPAAGWSSARSCSRSVSSTCRRSDCRS